MSKTAEYNNAKNIQIKAKLEESEPNSIKNSESIPRKHPEKSPVKIRGFTVLPFSTDTECEYSRSIKPHKANRQRSSRVPADKMTEYKEQSENGPGQSWPNRIKELEDQLAELNTEEARRISEASRMYLSDTSSSCRSANSRVLYRHSTANSSCEGSYGSRMPELGPADDSNEFSQMKQFCARIKTGDSNNNNALFNDASESYKGRIRGGAGCCGGSDSYTPQFVRYFRDGTQEPTVKNDNSNDLPKLIQQLMSEIEKVRKENSKNRKRIIELCVVLKQKEAQITECSELLCHIMNEKDDILTVVGEVQNGKLSKHVEYLRWILIRLHYENAAQASEIQSLLEESETKEDTLQECLLTKERLCSEKQKAEQALLSFSTQGACDLGMASIDGVPAYK